MLTAKSKRVGEYFVGHFRACSNGKREEELERRECSFPVSLNQRRGYIGDGEDELERVIMGEECKKSNLPPARYHPSMKALGRRIFGRRLKERVKGLKDNMFKGEIPPPIITDRCGFTGKNEERKPRGRGRRPWIDSLWTVVDVNVIPTRVCGVAPLLPKMEVIGARSIIRRRGSV
ncbi:hypothetical protein L2E82_10086 [Cichorium intybus]|uniref:Uncharacterized protein n=1 Tax=Cichorium intybus TaxID=13427 RepID=A0ACB9GAR9_CICIN|nr:hypothetical protein L2E82_10086 [Cichorium intybus]